MQLQRLQEDFLYNQSLYSLTKFNQINKFNQKKIHKIILNFGFKNVNFDKKKFLTFLMILELISGQKCVLTVNNKKHTRFKMKKGTVVGCKITLRKKNLYEFLDTLQLSLPRIENFKP
jgi:large subunit ribosomal protein L5